MTVGARETHDICWINLITPRVPEAQAFFARLFGWTYEGMGVPGATLVRVDGKAAGGLMDLDAGVMPPGTPAVIGVFVRVDDAEATAAKVRALGGTTEEVSHLENGSLCLCTDPNGAAFGLWQPKMQIGIEADTSRHGVASWFETITRDVKKARAFYESLLGWKGEEQNAMPGFTYTVMNLNGRPVAGLMPILPRMGDTPPFWSTSFTVDDVDATAALCKELGGQVHMGPDDIPGVGRFAAVASPQGVTFSIMKYVPPQT